jgi:hypothetical protein
LPLDQRLDGVALRAIIRSLRRRQRLQLAAAFAVRLKRLRRCDGLVPGQHLADPRNVLGR